MELTITHVEIETDLNVIAGFSSAQMYSHNFVFEMSYLTINKSIPNELTDILYTKN